MKRLIILTIAALMGLSATAQDTTRILQVYSNGQASWSKATANIDSIKFNGTQVLFNYDNGSLKTKSMSSIDSVVFTLNITDPADTISGDTTVVTTDSAIHITWNGTSTTIVNPWASAGVSITTDGGDVTVVSTADTADLVYVLSGTTTDGSISINTDRKLVVMLDDVSITNPDGPAILISGDKRATIHLTDGTENNLADGTSGSNKGALQSDGRFEIQGSGTLNIYGYVKHGIQSSGSTAILGGNINVLAAVKDGLNVDDFLMYDGSLTVSGTSGDCVDADQGYIYITGGTMNLTSTTDDIKGLTCDSTLTITGGNITINVSGDQSKAIKGGSLVDISGGTLDITAAGSIALEASGSGYDPSYCTGIKADSNIVISGGDITINCTSANAGGKGISCDYDIVISGGDLTVNTLGSSTTYTDTDGATSSYKPVSIKADGNLTITGGNLTSSSKGINLKADGNIVINASNTDTITLTNSGTGFTYGGSGTSVTDGFAPSCINADANIYIYGGIIYATATGTGGRGIVADGTYTQGSTNGDNDDLYISVTTSGSPVNASSSSGMGSSSDYWKGLPKGVKIEGTIRINSGYLLSYCAQTSGSTNGEAIESKDSIFIAGGVVEANAYDDPINADVYISISGGYVWAYSRNNDGMDCNGTRMDFTGGTIIIHGTECGIDNNMEESGVLYISNATVVVFGSTSAIESSTSVSNQKYLSLGSSGGGGWGGGSSSSYSATNGFAIYNSSNTLVMAFKSSTVSGSGFVNVAEPLYNGPKPPGGGGGGQSSSGSVYVTSPSITAGTYSVYSSPTISGGTNWHGLYSGATVTTSGSASSVTAQ